MASLLLMSKLARLKVARVFLARYDHGLGGFLNPNPFKKQWIIIIAEIHVN